MQRFAKEKEEKLAKQAVEAELKKCPPGTRRMPEDERQNMLEELNASKANISTELGKFPISMKTIAVQRRKEDLERQLDKIEQSIKIFSRDIVYVQF